MSNFITREIVAKEISYSLLNLYEPGLKRIQSLLTDLIAKEQRALIELENESAKFQDIDIHELNNLFLSIRESLMVMISVKKQMYWISERTTLLKQMALKIQDIKQRKALENAHSLEARLKREENLIARPSSSS